MSNREYELTVVVRVDPSDDVINETLEQVQSWVEVDEGGKILKTDRWGRKKLAYEIDKQREGYYVLYNAEISPANMPELERNLNLSSSILRWLIVRSDE